MDCIGRGGAKSWTRLSDFHFLGFGTDGVQRINVMGGAGGRLGLCWASQPAGPGPHLGHQLSSDNLGGSQRRGREDRVREQKARRAQRLSPHSPRTALLPRVGGVGWRKAKAGLRADPPGSITRGSQAPFCRDRGLPAAEEWAGESEGAKVPPEVSGVGKAELNGGKEVRREQNKS